RMMKVAGWLTGLMTVAIALGFLWYLKKEGVPFTGFSLLLCLLPFGFAVIGLWTLVKSKRRKALACIAAMVFSIVIGSATLLFPKLNDEIRLKKLSLATAGALRPDEKI